MFFRNMLKTTAKSISLVLSLILMSCATPPESIPEPPPEVEYTEPEIPENPMILQAEDDLQHARIQHAEWIVVEASIGPEPVTLSEILDLARQLQQQGDQAGATRLALKVSRFARLGIDQALQQANAKPFYPR